MKKAKDDDIKKNKVVKATKKVVKSKKKSKPKKKEIKLFPIGAGCPLKFKTKQSLEKKISAYFKECDERTMTVLTKLGTFVEVPNPRPYTVTGLAVALGTTRETLLDYERMRRKDTDLLKSIVSGKSEKKHTDQERKYAENKLKLYKELSDSLKVAKEKIKQFAEESLWTPKIAAGVIFNLKNNWNWEDKNVLAGDQKQPLFPPVEVITPKIKK